MKWNHPRADIAGQLPSFARLDSQTTPAREKRAVWGPEGAAVPTCELLLCHNRQGLRYTLLMIAFLSLELRIEAAHSLKDKRQVTRSLKDRLRSSFNVAVAELEPSLLWNQATIGVVSVSHSRDYLDGLMKNVERQATRIANNAGAEVTDSFVEFL
jgi:uncharacterized protein